VPCQRKWGKLGAKPCGSARERARFRTQQTHSACEAFLPLFSGVRDSQPRVCAFSSIVYSNPEQILRLISKPKRFPALQPTNIKSALMSDRVEIFYRNPCR